MFNLAFNVCDTEGFLRIMYFIKLAMNILRFVIPIILIVMIIFDLFKNTISPDNKDGMKKITNRLIAAVIVFIVPTLVNLVVIFMDYIFDNADETDYKISSCYTNANMNCINNIENYLECSEFSDDEKKYCQKFRQCNDYKLTNDCSIETVANQQNCSSINKDKDGNANFKYIKYAIGTSFNYD